MGGALDQPPILDATTLNVSLFDKNKIEDVANTPKSATTLGKPINVGNSVFQ